MTRPLLDLFKIEEGHPRVDLIKKFVFRHKAVVSIPLQSRKSQKHRNLMEHVSKIS